MQLIVTFLLSMGLRHPSCPTYRVITCLYCWLTHGQDKIMGIAKMDKYKEVLNMKKYFALRRSFAPPPIKYVKMLPAQPSKFMKLHPELASFYKDNPAVACPLDTEILPALAETFPLRKPKRSTQESWGMVMQEEFKPVVGSQWCDMAGQGAIMQLCRCMHQQRSYRCASCVCACVHVQRSHRCVDVCNGSDRIALS